MKQISFLLFVLATISLVSCSSSEKLERPCIWVKQSDREKILKKIKQQAWAKEYYASFVERVQADIEAHQKNPDEYLRALPLDWENQISGTSPPFLTKNERKNVLPRRYLHTALDCGIIYFLEDLKAKTLIALAREDGLISTKTGLVTMDVIKSVHWHEVEWRRQKTDSPAFRDIVDWPHPRSTGPNASVGETDGFEFTHINTVVNAFHYRTLVIMAQIAKVLHKTADADFFQRRAELVNQSFNDVLLDPNTGIYRDGEGSEHNSLHANMFPLAFGLVPEENLEKVARFVKGRGLVCSPYGALYLLESLYETGDSEYALELLTSLGERSWGRWIYEFGSTVSLESWGPEFKPNLDWSHAWGSAPGSIIPRKLMGIEPLEPGYRKIRIRPQPGDLDQASIIYPTIRGEVRRNIPVSLTKHLNSVFAFRPIWKPKSIFPAWVQRCR